MVQSYKELLAYQKSYALVMAVYAVTKGFPGEELYGLSSQMRRCAVSIPSNIAEGYMRGTKEYTHYLRVALGSAAELDTQLSLAKDLGYLTPDKHSQLTADLEEILKLLRTYLNKLTAHTNTIREDPTPYDLDN